MVEDFGDEATSVAAATSLAVVVTSVVAEEVEEMREVEEATEVVVIVAVAVETITTNRLTEGDLRINSRITAR